MSARADKHQRILAELLTRPGNDVCAECRERAPRWSSWNIGIFICVHCASIHRKMGTHISKVKSVTLDTWTKDQVESVKNMGNLKANALYNPDEQRHKPPTNYDESDRDSEMEIYIRNKYQYKKFMAASSAASGSSAPAAPSAPQRAPVRSPSPPAPAPRPPAKDPVPGRVGGTSLGEASEFDKVIRAPSRAKSTPIVSPSVNGVPGRVNVLSPGSPAVPSVPSTSRAPVFAPTLPYRPSTAAALEAPYASSSAAASTSSSAWPSSSSYRTANTASAPPVPPVTYPMRPYSAASGSLPSASTTPANQPPLQYLTSNGATTTTPTTMSNGIWDDVFVLSGPGASGVSSGMGGATAASQLGSSAFGGAGAGLGGQTTLNGLGRTNTLASSSLSPFSASTTASPSLVPNPRSFSLPLSQLQTGSTLSPVVTGASGYSTASTTSSLGGSGAPNPFMGLNANSSALSLGAGSTGTGASGLSGATLNPYSGLGANAFSNPSPVGTTATTPDPWAALAGGAQQVSSPTGLGPNDQLTSAFGGMSLGGASPGGGMSSLSRSPFQTQPTGSSAFSNTSSLPSLSTGSTFASTGSSASNFNPYSNMSSMGSLQTQPTGMNGLGGMGMGMNNLGGGNAGVGGISGLGASAFGTTGAAPSNNATSQSSFAQSMLPAHLKSQSPAPSMNPFGAAGGASPSNMGGAGGVGGGAAGNPWGNQGMGMSQAQLVAQQQAAGQAAFGGLFAAAYGNGYGNGAGAGGPGGQGGAQGW